MSCNDLHTYWLSLGHTLDREEGAEGGWAAGALYWRVVVVVVEDVVEAVGGDGCG